MAEQLTFDLPVRDSRERGDYFVSDANALALTRLDNTKTWPNRKLILVGANGAGKTHLAHVWADANNAHLLGPGDLNKLDVPAVGRAVVLDDADTVAEDQEEALFHLHNHLGSAGLSFLLTAQLPPVQWPLSLPDLRSRMTATDSVRIDAPDDALLAAVLLKLFADRQLAVAPNVISWLVARMDRSFADAQHLVAQLDQAALSEGRAVTRSLAQQVLSELRNE